MKPIKCCATCIHYAGTLHTTEKILLIKLWSRENDKCRNDTRNDEKII